VSAGNRRWVYLEGGRGEPAVFLHGFGVDKDHFWTFLHGFSKSYRVVVPDLPGFGEGTRRLTDGYDIPTQVKRLNKFLERLGLDSFHLFGESLGGYIGGYYASEYPEKVRTLALMDAGGVSPAVPSDALRLFEESGKVILVYRTVEEFEEFISFVFKKAPWIPGPFKRHFAMMGALNHEFNSKIVQDILDTGMYLLESRLPEISARTLVIWGRNDRLFDESVVEKFVTRIPGCRAVVIEDCGHVPYFEKPKEAKQAYREFLKSLS
jgi:abhydrolase domain-containing protein 6